jgi:hypothetical protein
MNADCGGMPDGIAMILNGGQTCPSIETSRPFTADFIWTLNTVAPLK